MHAVDEVVRWEKPGPGTWELDQSHCGPAPCPIQRELFEVCAPRGMEEGLTLFGSPLKTMDVRWVNGKFYRRLVPLVGGGSDLPAPPASVLWLVTRLHPAFRRAERRARESLETKRWRAELDRWEREWKPALVQRNEEFSAADVTTMDASVLAGHIAAVHAHLERSTALHFRLHVSDMGPLGNLMVHLEDWGLHADDTFRALVASSPATRAPAARLRELAAALRSAGADPAAVESLDDVRRVSAEAGVLLDGYLGTHGWRLTTGYEIEDLCLVELPEVVVRSIHAAAGDTSENIAGDGAAELDRLREEVPERHRAEFDELAEDARLSYGLRDENGPLTYEWPAGLLRRALLEAGRRLDLGPGVFELTLDEVVAMLTDGVEAGPVLAEIERRALERQAWAALTDPPRRLGREEGPPPLDVMPEYLGRFARIVFAVVAALEAPAGAEALSGIGVGTTRYVGRARVVHDAAAALAGVEPGDVVVTPYTAPTYNAVLSMAGAIVTEQGGLLCHAAVIARELDLPAVIGAAEAMTRIPDGATVEVDPAAGRVRVLP